MALATIAPTTGAPSASRRRLSASSGSSPSLGEVSTDGVVPLSLTLDHFGPRRKRPRCMPLYPALLGTPRPTRRRPWPRHVCARRAEKYFCDLLHSRSACPVEEALSTGCVPRAHHDEVEISSRAGLRRCTAPLHGPMPRLYHATDAGHEAGEVPPNVRRRLRGAVLARLGLRGRAGGRERLRLEVDLLSTDALFLRRFTGSAPTSARPRSRLLGVAEPVRTYARLTQPFNVIPATRDGHALRAHGRCLPFSVQLVATRANGCAASRGAGL